MTSLLAEIVPTNVFHAEHQAAFPSICVALQFPDMITSVTSSDDGDDTSASSNGVSAMDESDDKDIVAGDVIDDDVVTRSVINSLDYHTVLPRSLKMTNVCAENHRCTRELHRELRKMRAERKKARSQIDHSQRDFIVQQVFDKRLHPFYSRPPGSTPRTMNHQLTERRSTVTRDRRRRRVKKKGGKMWEYEDIDMTSSSEIRRTGHIELEDGQTTKRRGVVENNSCATAPDIRERVDTPSAGEFENTSAEPSQPVHLTTNSRVRKSPGQANDFGSVESFNDRPSVIPVAVRNVKNSLAVTEARLKRTRPDKQNSVTLVKKLSEPVEGNQDDAMPRHAPRRKQDITEFRKLEDSTRMFPKLTRLVNEPNSANEHLREDTFHLPQLVERVPASSSKSNYAELIDVLANSVCTHLHKLKLRHDYDDITTIQSRDRMKEYRRQLLRRTRRPLVLNSHF